MSIKNKYTSRRCISLYPIMNMKWKLLTQLWNIDRFSSEQNFFVQKKLIFIQRRKIEKKALNYWFSPRIENWRSRFIRYSKWIQYLLEKMKWKQECAIGSPNELNNHNIRSFISRYLKTMFSISDMKFQSFLFKINISWKKKYLWNELYHSFDLFLRLCFKSVCPAMFKIIFADQTIKWIWIQNVVKEVVTCVSSSLSSRNFSHQFKLRCNL